MRGVQQCIAHKILEHLDYSSLKNASLISADWCKAIKIGNIWQKLFERNVSKLCIYNCVCVYRMMLQLIYIFL